MNFVPMLKWGSLGASAALFLLDVLYVQTKGTTISKWLWDLPLPRWIPYAAGVAIYLGSFFLWDWKVASLGVVAFVLGHWSRFGR